MSNVPITVQENSRYIQTFPLVASWSTDFTNYVPIFHVCTNASSAGVLLSNLSAYCTVSAQLITIDIPANAPEIVTAAWYLGCYNINVHHATDPTKALRVSEGYFNISEAVN